MVDRTLYWDENQSRTFDYVQDSKDTLKAIAQMMGDVLGSTSTVIGNLEATANSPANLSINLSAGSIYQLADIDATANGAFAQDTTQVLQQGIIGAQAISLSTAGIAAGQSQWQLIEAQFSQTDSIRSGDPNGGLLFFYDSSNVSQPFQGPGGSGTTTPTVRQGLVTVQVITGAAATTGSEVPPEPSPGWTPLYLIDLSYGQTQITNAQIHDAGPSVGTGVPATYPAAPFLAGLTNAHHGGVPGQAPKINLATEVQGLLPLANMVAVRQVLYGGLTLYVDPVNGSDNNRGLLPTSAFQTIQAAINAAYHDYDFNGNGCSIQLVNGTYAYSPGSVGFAAIFSGLPFGCPAGQLSLIGNDASPSSVVMSITQGNGLLCQLGAYLNVHGLTIEASGQNTSLTDTLGYGVDVGTAWLNIWNCIIGSCGEAQISCGNGAVVTFDTLPMTLTGTTPLSLACSQGGQIWIVGSTITVEGLDCTTAFASAYEAGNINAYQNTFVGSATGPKYNVASNGTITTSGGGVDYFPGSVAGYADPYGAYY